MGCKWHFLLDVNPETGTIIFNVGQVKELVEDIEPGRRPRPRTIERRIGTVSAKGRKPGSAGHAAFKKGERKILGALKKAVETGSPMTCLLDAVRDGRTYTLEEVGAVFNITRERVRQIEVKGLVSLRRETRYHRDLHTWEESRRD